MHMTRRRPRTRRADIALLLAVVALVATMSPGIAGTRRADAATRDVEVTDTGTSDQQLHVLPAITLTRDADTHTSWDVAIVNGGEMTLTIDLRVVETEGDKDGIRAGSRAVPWATLPRPQVTLGAGQRADLTLSLRPSPDALPAAISLLATALGETDVTAIATAVLWPTGHVPTVVLEVQSDAVEVSSLEPAVVDVAIRASAFPRAAVARTVGPLVVLAHAPRTIVIERPDGIFGSTVEAVAAVDGTEIARVLEAESLSPAALLLVALALTLVVTAGTAAARRLRRT